MCTVSRLGQLMAAAYGRRRSHPFRQLHMADTAILCEAAVFRKGEGKKEAITEEATPGKKPRAVWDWCLPGGGSAVVWLHRPTPGAHALGS